MVLVHDSGHDYVLKGYDSRGRLKSVTGYGKSMYDTVQEAEGYGLKMGHADGVSGSQEGLR